MCTLREVALLLGHFGRACQAPICYKFRDRVRWHKADAHTYAFMAEIHDAWISHGRHETSQCHAITCQSFSTRRSLPLPHIIQRPLSDGLTHKVDKHRRATATLPAVQQRRRVRSARAWFPPHIDLWRIQHGSRVGSEDPLYALASFNDEAHASGALAGMEKKKKEKEARYLHTHKRETAATVGLQGPPCLGMFSASPFSERSRRHGIRRPLPAHVRVSSTACFLIGCIARMTSHTPAIRHLTNFTSNTLKPTTRSALYGSRSSRHMRYSPLRATTLMDNIRRS